MSARPTGPPVWSRASPPHGLGKGRGWLGSRADPMTDPTHPSDPERPIPMPLGRVVANARTTLGFVPDAGAGLIITDPPWDLGGGQYFTACANYPRLPVATIVEILSDARRALVPGGHLYLFATTGPEISHVASTFQAYGWRLLRVLAWDKGISHGLGAYRNAWEPVFIFSNGASRGFAKHQTYSSLLRARSIGKRTAKPWELYEVFMEMSSRPGELVVDPFCGTNPLAVAASRLGNRRWLAGDVLSPLEIEASLRARRRRRGPQPDPTRPDAKNPDPQPAGSQPDPTPNPTRDPTQTGATI